MRALGTALLAIILGGALGCAQPPPNDPAILTIGVFDDLTGLDPAQHQQPAVLGIARDVFDTLVRAHPGSSDLQPGIASSWSVSPDGTTWTFVLRPGLKFSDGTPLDAAAVKANFDRWRVSNDPNREGLDYPGFAEWFGGFDAASLISDVRAATPTSVVIVTRVPFAPLPHYLTLPSFGIGSSTAFANDFKLYDEIPIGSGRYRVADFRGGDHVTLEPNPLWQGPPAKLPGIIVRAIPDPPSAALSLEKDDLDAAADPPPAVAHDIASRDTMRLIRWPSSSVCYVIFDSDRPPFDAPEARRAAAEALDRVAISSDFGDPALKPARGWFPLGMLGDDPNVAAIQYDPAAARAVLSLLHGPNQQITLFYPATANELLPDPGAVAHQIQKDLSATGLLVTLNATDSFAIPADLSGGALALGVVSSQSGDPDEVMVPLTASWHDPAFAAVAGRGRTTADQTARGRAYREIEDLIADRSIAVPLVHPARAAGVSARATVPLDSAQLPP